MFFCKTAYNEKIVVYAIYEEGNLKIIIRDIYNKDEVYKEIIDEFPNIAVGSYIIKDARVINNHLVYLNYYLGNDWKEKKNFIFVNNEGKSVDDIAVELGYEEYVRGLIPNRE